MDRYVIDGIFLTKRITGIQRYALEITKALDKMVEYNCLEIVVPEYYEGNLKFNNIKMVKYGNRSRRLWEQWDFHNYLKKHNARGIYFENTIPLGEKEGIVVLHDISIRVNPKLFLKTNKDRLSLIWRRIVYRAIVNSNMKIVTVSEFSKSEIIKYYNVKPERITVINNAWQHIEAISEEDSVLQKNGLQKKQYFFAMSSMNQNKNFKWIANAANKNKNEIFVIAGGGNITQVIKSQYRELNNLISLGYVTDEQAKALMHYCKAFIFPSFYEGFGIPPLEAVAAGTSAIILSDIPCLREIYGDCGTYVNPYDYDVDFNNINIKPVNSTGILDKYSWEKSAENLLKIID